MSDGTYEQCHYQNSVMVSFTVVSNDTSLICSDLVIMHDYGNITYVLCTKQEESSHHVLIYSIDYYARTSALVINHTIP